MSYIYPEDAWSVTDVTGKNITVERQPKNTQVGDKADAYILDWYQAQQLGIALVAAAQASLHGMVGNPTLLYKEGEPEEWLSAIEPS